MSKIFVDQVDPKTATTLTLGTTGDTVDIPSGVTLSGAGTITASAANLAASGAGGVTGTLPIANGGTGATTLAGAGLSNTPAWDAYLSANQTGLTSGGWTKVQFDTEVFDTDSAYDNATDKFTVPSGGAGKYFITSFAKINAVIWSATLIGTGMRITVNGANRKESILFAATGAVYAEGKGVNCVLALDASDEVEVYAYYQDNGGGAGNITGGSDYDTFFTGYKLIG